MTREEAKAYIIQHCIPNYPKMDKTEWDAAMGKAIEALRQPDPRSFSCGQENDMVSRQAALDAIMGQPPEPHYPAWYAAQIEKLPAVQPDHVADIGKKVCVDTISRQAALKKLAVYIHLIDKTMGKGLLTDDDCMEAAKSVLGEDELPAVQPATNCSEIPNSSDDTISRRAAIDCVTYDVEHTIECLKALPPAQNAQDGDLNWAIPSVLSNLVPAGVADGVVQNQLHLEESIHRIKQLTGISIDDLIDLFAQGYELKAPSAQPDIIRCKDCKHRDKYGCCKYWKGLAMADIPIATDDNDFCSYAEQKGEQDDR